MNNPTEEQRLYKEHHREEAMRLQRVLNAAGAPYTLQDAEYIWMEYSEELWAAGWMGMPESDQDLLREACKVIDWK